MSGSKVLLAGRMVPGPGIRLLICVIIFAPVPVIADLIIQLTDGQRIVVPVDQEKIDRIIFTPAGGLIDRQISAKPSNGTIDSPKPAQGRIIRVGAKRELKYPSDAARIAREGDTIEIDAGVYHNDYAKWRQNKITIRGVGGMAHLKSKGLIPNRKAIWIIDGNDVAIDNIEFSGAAVRDTNGAGIRHQGGNLRLTNTFFHDNEFSILTGKLPNAVIEIESSRFWHQKRPRRHTHGIYIGQVRRLRLVGNHFKGTDQGHQVKSRALENHILYNRIEDVPGGNSSRLIDLSNCGLSFVIGNDLHQAATSENFNAIGYGPEGCQRRNDQEMKLFVINNTFINDAANGDFVRNFAGGDVLVANNLVLGRGKLLEGKGSTKANRRLRQGKPGRRTWQAPTRSEVIDKAVELPAVAGHSLVPKMEFQPPTGTRPRPRVGKLDIGSREVLR